MKPGDLLFPRKIHRDLPTDIHLGLFTGQYDEFERKMIVWANGKVHYLEEWEEKYYEVINETG